MPVRPLYHRVLVRLDPPAEVSAGGLHIPDAHRPPPDRGKVVRVGDGDEARRPAVEVGDLVVLSRYAGDHVPADLVGDEAEGDFVLVEDAAILAVIGHANSTPQ